TDALAMAMDLDMRRWWTATGPSYLNHVSKSQLLAVVTEAVDINAAAPLASLKKEAAVAGAEQAMAGCGWLPRCLRTGIQSAAAEEAGAAHTEHAESELEEDTDAALA